MSWITSQTIENGFGVLFKNRAISGFLLTVRFLQFHYLLFINYNRRQQSVRKHGHIRQEFIAAFSSLTPLIHSI